CPFASGLCAKRVENGGWFPTCPISQRRNPTSTSDSRPNAVDLPDKIGLMSRCLGFPQIRKKNESVPNICVTLLSQSHHRRIQQRIPKVQGHVTSCYTLKVTQNFGPFTSNCNFCHFAIKIASFQ
ncbi:hypothetical protein COCCADRAFT_94757, partial [Bipolaris zeicola 26-R-13]